MNTLCLEFLQGGKLYQLPILYYIFGRITRQEVHIYGLSYERGVYSLGHNKISRNLYVPIQLYVEWPKNPLCQISEKFLSCENPVAKTKDDAFQMICFRLDFFLFAWSASNLTKSQLVTLKLRNLLLQYGKFQPSKIAKILKNQNSVPVNVLKWQISQFLNPLN